MDNIRKHGGLDCSPSSSMRAGPRSRPGSPTRPGAFQRRGSLPSDGRQLLDDSLRIVEETRGRPRSPMRALLEWLSCPGERLSFDLENSSTFRRSSSSASSVRSMIDERIRMANEERSRSRYNTSVEPPSPFRSGTPFEYEYAHMRRCSSAVSDMSDISDSLGPSDMEPENRSERDTRWSDGLHRDPFTSEAVTTSTSVHPIDRTPSFSPPYMRPKVQRLSSCAAHSDEDQQWTTRGGNDGASDAYERLHQLPCTALQQPALSTPGESNVPECLPADPATLPDLQALRLSSRGSQARPPSPDVDEREIARGRKRRRDSPQKAGPCRACGICGKNFTRRTLRDNHLRTHTNERPFACSQEGCTQTFKQKNDQTRHERTAHGEKTFICGGVLDSGMQWGCGKAFARSDGLLEHQTKTEKGRRCLQQRDEG